MMVSLGKHIKLVGGGTPSKAIEEYWDGDIPWASVKDFKSEYLSSTQDYISQKGLENSSTRIIPKGTLLIATRMAVGKVVIPSIDVAINQDLKAIYCNSSLNQKFLFYILKSKADHFDSVATGATVKGIKINHITDLQIPLPPLLQQQKIANILDAVDAIRQNDKDLIGKYDELTQALFLDMFGDPVSNPKGWEMKIMANVCEKISVGFVGICEPYYTDKENGIPMLRTGNLGEGFLRYDKMKYVTEEFHLKHKKSQLLIDDILIARHGDNGKAVLYNGEYEKANCLNIIILRPAKGLLNGTYNVNMLNNESTRNKILGKTGGATQKVVNTKEIQKLIVPIPPIKLQNQFAERVALIEEQKAIAQKSLEKSEELFNSLLQKAFKGELV